MPFWQKVRRRCPSRENKLLRTDSPFPCRGLARSGAVALHGDLGIDVDIHIEPVGHFLPPDLYHALLYAWAKDQFADEQELTRAREEIRSQGGVTTAEVLEFLRGLGSNGRGPA